MPRGRNRDFQQSKMRPDAPWLEKFFQTVYGNVKQDLAAKIVREWGVLLKRERKLAEAKQRLGDARCATAAREFKRAFPNWKRTDAFPLPPEGFKVDGTAFLWALDNAEFEQRKQEAERRLLSACEAAMRQADDRFFARMAEALRAYNQRRGKPAEPYRYAILQFLGPGERTEKTLADVQEMLSKVFGSEFDRAQVHRWCKALGYKLARKSSARTGKHWRGIQKLGRRVPPDVAAKMLLKVLYPSDNAEV
jgi:nitrogen fixation-related uncharacterized protein